MYAKFKQSLEAGTLDVCSVAQQVANVWSIIDQQCVTAVKPGTAQGENSHWKTVRIFVSSTFTDFHSEREILVKKVFPTLKEWCQERRLHLVECDLRWGVPKDSTAVTTIATCMEELQRCHTETNGNPFFINLLGDRYGWVPDTNELPAQLREKYEWIKGVSITHMEILYGAYRLASPNALFLIRDSEFLQDVPHDKLSKFTEKQALSQHHVSVLKEKLKEQFTQQVMTYNAQVSGVDSTTGREKVKVTGLESKTEDILEFFKRAITRMYPNITTESSTGFDPHSAMMEVKAVQVLGREGELNDLAQFALGQKTTEHLNYQFPPLQGWSKSPVSEEAFTKVLQRLPLEERDTPILAVVGQPGLGKSAVLAKLAQALTRRGVRVLYHCVGVTGDSFMSHHIVTRLVQWLKDCFPDDTQSYTQTDDNAQLIKQLSDIFALLRHRAEQLVWIIDGLNELHDKQATHHLSWLCARTPGNLRCIVSCSTEHLPTMQRLYDMKCACVLLSEFSDASRRVMVEHFFNTYNKRLDAVQLSSLVSHGGAATPLWLAVACEELRVHGDFVTLTHKIQHIPANLEGLFEMVIGRLMAEDTTAYMDKLLGLICYSLGGLPESHICALLGDQESKTPASLLSWATLRMFLKPLLRTVIPPRGDTRVQFFHNSVLQTVRHILPSNSEVKWHGYLARYYDTMCDDAMLTISELPHHLMHAGHKSRLVSFIREDRRALVIQAFLASDYLNRVRCKFPAMPSGNKIHDKYYVMCEKCALFRRTVRGHSVKEACVICHKWSPHEHGNKPMYCNKHAFQWHAPEGHGKCCMCGHLSPADKMRPGKYCGMCSVRAHTCCQLITDEQEQFKARNTALI